MYTVNPYFEELQKCIVSEKSRLIEYKIKQEIFTSLPTLNDQEEKTFKKIGIELGLKKERRRKFFDYMKKNYPNFNELSYINEDLFFDLYELEIFSKEIFSLNSCDEDHNENSYFNNYIFSLYNSYNQQTITKVNKYPNNQENLKKFDTSFLVYFKFLKNSNSNFLVPTFWTKFSFNINDINNEKLLSILKFDSRLDNKSLILNIS